MSSKCFLCPVFRRVRKIAKRGYYRRNICPSFRPSVLMEQLGSLWTDIHELSYLNFCQKSVEKTLVLLKSDKNKGHFTGMRVHICYNMLLNYS